MSLAGKILIGCGIALLIPVGAIIYLVWALHAFEAPPTFSGQLGKLVESACHGDIKGIEKAHSLGADPNGEGLTYDEGGGSHSHAPLIWTLETCPNLQGAQALLKIGANPNKPSEGVTPTLVAAGMENPAFLELMLKQGGDPNVSGDLDTSDDWALKRAFNIGRKTGDWRNYDLLLSSGADINGEHAQTTIAWTAAFYMRFDKVEELLKRGYSHDLEGLASEVNDHPDRVPQEQLAYRDKVIALLEQNGVHWPVPPPQERISGTVWHNPDRTLWVKWYAPKAKANKKADARKYYYHLLPGQPEYDALLARTGALRPYQSKDLVRQPGDPQ